MVAVYEVFHRLLPNLCSCLLAVADLIVQASIYQIGCFICLSSDLALFLSATAGICKLALLFMFALCIVEWLT